MRQCYFKLIIIVCLLLPTIIYGQKANPKEILIKGWNYQILPSFVYNPDKGLQYGALASIYYYNDSSRYPNYKYNLYLQTSLTTKRGFVNYLFFDSKNLFSKKIRLTADLSYIKDVFEQFYGLNGYDAQYNHNYEMPKNSQYIFRNYYYLHQATGSAVVDIKREFAFPYLYGDVGAGYYNIAIQPFTWNNQPTLFEKYISSGAIPQSQKDGGVTTYLKAALVIDTRDDEAMPARGIWDEAIYINAPGFLKNRFTYSQVALIHRQYFRLFPGLVFAYRLAYQTRLSGEMPFYMLPYLVSTFRTQDALGGAETIRGVLNRRIVGDGFEFGNFEFRYIFINTALLNNNIGIGLNTFADMGKIIKLYHIGSTLNDTAFDYKSGYDKMHYSTGGGIQVSINHNFIVSFVYGRAINEKDGKGGFYLNLDYLF